MQPLSPEAQARLAAFRRAESPDDAVAERCLAALEPRLAEPYTPESSGPGERAPRVRRLVAVGVAALALAAGLVLAVMWTGAGPRRDDAGFAAPYQHTGERAAHDVRPRGAGDSSGALDHAADARDPDRDAGAPAPQSDDSYESADRAADAPAPQSDDSHGSSDRAADAPTTNGAPPDSQATDSPATDSHATDSHASSDSQVEARASDGSASGSPRAPAARPSGDATGSRPRAPGGEGKRPRASADDLAAEVALLREAKLAEPRRRLELLDELARRFPDGALAAERGLLEIEARCALGDVDVARALARRFPQTFPGSSLAARAARACADDDAP